MPNNQIQSLTISGTTYDIVDKTSGYITADSPALTGTPTAPTPLSGADDTQIATVKYVQDAMAGAGAGTVTSVGIANTTDGGLSVSGSPITSSGTISVGHSNVLASAQTTSGIYPIKIDKNGHISEYGSAVSIPTKTSELINDSNFVSAIDLSDNLFSTLYYLNVSGSTASLVNASSAPISIASLAAAFRSVSGVQIAQVLNVSGSNFKLRMYDIVDADTINGTVRLVAVDDDTVYVADLADAGSGLVGTISTVSIPTVPTNVSAFTNDAGYISTETDPTVPSWAKASSKPTYTASEVGALPDTTTIPSKTSDLTNDSGFITGMTILSYGSSTWQDFLNAYNANKVVYCRASSNSNPASGSQTRLAFMAYVNNATTPTNVEFQYYRSVNTHTESQQGDQVYVYKLDKTAGWSVTAREASVKVVAGTGLSGTYSNGTMTLTGPTISLNGSSTTSASFYAPTSAGTSGYVLTSSGSGAPTWAAAPSSPSYTATSPIDITSNDISHEDSGVTAGTYDGGGVKSTGFYVPSITVDAKGHVTSATDLGNLIPVNTYNSSDPVYGMLLAASSWALATRSYSSYPSILAAGNTSTTITISSDSNSAHTYKNYFRVVDVEAFDAVTKEPVIVDWSASALYSNNSSVTVTVSIASAHTNNIWLYVLLSIGYGSM